jgi:DNA polymerase-4
MEGTESLSPVAESAVTAPGAPQRKIVHVDMDAFYASVEQRDNPELRGKPVVVAWRGARSVVCAASYEARKFGVRSAMAAKHAERLCPEAVFVPPDFTRYRAVSQQVRGIFARHTPLIEPLSLDEAYLDVTQPLSNLHSATAIAEAIRAAIREELNLTASAGVAPNKFLAKIASDWRKPDGLFVIRPREVLDFLEPLAVERLPGVGKVTQNRLAALGIATIGQLRTHSAAELERTFGRYGLRLANLALGIDHGRVEPNRPTRSISAEDTFSEDLPLESIAAELPPLADKVWRAAQRVGRPARTVVLKLKTREFRILTRSLTPAQPPDSAEALARLAVSLLDRVDEAATERYRLAGVGLSNFDLPDDSPQSTLF